MRKLFPLKTVSFNSKNTYLGDEIKLSDKATIVGFGEQSNVTSNPLRVRMKDAAQDNDLYEISGANEFGISKCGRLLDI